MRRFLYTFGALITVPVIGITGSTVYLYPDLRYNPQQFHLAFMRVYRVIRAGSNMAFRYLVNQEENMDDKHLYGALQLRDAFQRNAGLYIKFGQILGSLDFIIPDPYRRTFEVMCIQNLETPYEQIKEAIESSLGKLEDVFKEFDPKPISSASIAQVHKATLKDGREVAVKVQHPWLKQQMEGDIRLIEIFVDIAERIFEGFKYKWLAEELRVNLPKELDFPLEAQNSVRIRQEMEILPKIKVPEVYNFNEKVIVMEFIHGVSLLEAIANPDLYDHKDIADTISRAFSHQIFQLGFVHSDPHQGNIMIRKHRGRQQIVLLDHGLYTHLDDKLRFSYSLLWRGLLMRNLDDIKKATQELGAEDNYKLFSAMVTSKRFNDLVSSKSMEERLRRPKEQAEIDVLIRKATKHHKRITQLLNNINRKLLMLFKINDFLKNIDNRLGSPVNTYQITVHRLIYEVPICLRYVLPKGTLEQEFHDKIQLQTQIDDLQSAVDAFEIVHQICLNVLINFIYYFIMNPGGYQQSSFQTYAGAQQPGYSYNQQGQGFQQPQGQGFQQPQGQGFTQQQGFPQQGLNTQFQQQGLNSQFQQQGGLQQQQRSIPASPQVNRGTYQQPVSPYGGVNQVRQTISPQLRPQYGQQQLYSPSTVTISPQKLPPTYIQTVSPPQVVAPPQQLVKEIHHIERPLEVVSIEEIEAPWRVKCATIERQILELQIQLRKGGMPTIETVEVVDDSKVKELEARKAQLLKELQDLENEMNQLRDQIQQVQMEIEEQTSSQITYYSNEIETWKKRFRELQDEDAKVDIELRNATKELAELKKQQAQPMKQSRN